MLLKESFSRFLVVCGVVLLHLSVAGQTVQHTDTLKEVVISAWGNSRTRQQNAASIALLNSSDFRSAAGRSLVPVFNQIPGLQMEERSPGSYRISIRGSSIRSPYGVRNIKVYLDGFSLTDAGGNTYINSLDVENIGSAEVIKGPAGSVYGAGTGGVVLLRSFASADTGMHASVFARSGSYGLRSIGFQGTTTTKNVSSSVFLSDFRTTGYRVNTALERQVIQYRASVKAGKKDQVGVSALYSDLKYQTPGGLTLAEYTINPRQARPATKVTPSVTSQHAAIYTQQVLLGVSNRYQISRSFYNESSASLSGVRFRNPYITNYERKTEEDYSLRSVLHFIHPVLGRNLHAQAGIEYNNYYSPDRDYRNKGGMPDSITRDDEITDTQLTAFLQAEAELPFGLLATAALSFNRVHYQVYRFSQAVPGLLNRPFSAVVSPRFSLLKVISPQVSVYSSLSYGYSPPSNLETLSATGVFNATLQPERASTFEVGAKGTRVLSGLLDFDITAFVNHVTNTIVRRTNLKGQEYFINEGTTLEKGLELSSYFYVVRNYSGLFRNVTLRGAATASDFHFGSQGPGSVVVPGRPLTGSAPYTADAGLIWATVANLGLESELRYSDRIPLADIGTEKAKAFTVISSRLTFSPSVGKVRIETFAAGDNLFNRKYSLGNDLNAAAGRYYNAAPLRNFVFGVKIRY